MKKFILDLTVTENIKLHANYVLLKLTSQSLLPEMLPGQFAELRVDGSPTTFLRRPISINFVDKQRNEVWFLIQLLGDGTRRLAEVNPGDVINVVLPLGNGYTMPQNPSDKLLLVGGGVGTAPMLYLGEQLAKNGHKPTFLLGARSDKDLLQLEEEKEKNKERIRKAYGESASGIGTRNLRKRRHIYLFNAEDLDNDDIIAMVEDSPTYLRDKTTLGKIKAKAALEEEIATEEAIDDSGVITF